MIIGQTSSFSIVRYTFWHSWYHGGWREPQSHSKSFHTIPLPWVDSACFTGNTRIFSRPLVAIMTVYKTFYVEYSFSAAENIFLELWLIFEPSQHHLSKFHTIVSVFGRECVAAVGLPISTFKLIFEHITYTAEGKFTLLCVPSRKSFKWNQLMRFMVDLGSWWQIMVPILNFK